MTDLSENIDTVEPPSFLAEYTGSFLAGDGRTLDAILRIQFELAAELWTVKQRVRILEGVLTDAGVVAADAVESRHLVPRTRAQRAQRQEFVETLFRHLLLADRDEPLTAVADEAAESPMHGRLGR